MQKNHLHPERIHSLTLSVESLWIARSIQDTLDIALSNPSLMDGLQPERRHALRLNRDVFERLGIYGCSPQHVSPWSIEWTATSRVELIRQVAVHWRSLIDTAFGTAVSAQLIQALTNEEVVVLDQIQRFSHSLQLNYTSASHCMSQQMHVMATRREIQRAQQRSAYLESASSRK
jgi:hypothetical protein